MPSELDIPIDEYYQQILSLSAEVILASNNEDYQKSEQLLQKRLLLLKELAGVVNTQARDSEQFIYYQTFLSKLQKDDENQLAFLKRELVNVAEENANQQKISKALNVYGQVMKRG